MLDLAFVREHLSVVEEKLRSRNANPEQVLGGFREIDTRRRALTHELETALARRNELSREDRSADGRGEKRLDHA